MVCRRLQNCGAGGTLFETRGQPERSGPRRGPRSLPGDAQIRACKPHLSAFPRSFVETDDRESASASAERAATAFVAEENSLSVRLNEASHLLSALSQK